MSMLDRFVGRFRRSTSTAKPTSDPDVMYQPRPMTSFLDGLSKEQRTKLQVYRGQESHGEKGSSAEAL